MRLGSKEEFVEEYVQGYMSVNAGEFQDMDADEVEQKIQGCYEKAANTWATLSAYKVIGEKVRSGEIEYKSNEYYESIYDEKTSNSL